MKKILVILGPNLNMVGVREKGIYGEETASDIEKQIISYAESNGFSAEVFQSNHEGDLIDKIHSANEQEETEKDIPETETVNEPTEESPEATAGQDAS